MQRLFAPLFVLLYAQGALADAQPAAPSAESSSPSPPSPPSPSSPPSTSVEPAAAPAAAAPAAATTPAADPAAPAVLVSMAALLDDPAAEAEVASCNAQLAREGDGVAQRDCYLRVVAAHRGTVGALKAETALTILELQGKPAVDDEAGVLIPAGRLGVTTVAGLFGVWNGVAGGAIVSANVPDLQGAGLIAGTGAVAVALGVGMGVGGYYLADRLALDEGAARLVASSIVWGSVVGVGLAPLAIEPFASSASASVTAGVGAVVAAGYVGAGAGLLLASLTKLDEAQVSMINSGGIIGATVGLALLPNLLEARVTGAAPYSLAFSGATVAGLGAGALLGRSFDLTWGESLLCDLGLVLGGVVGGTTSLVLGASGVSSVTVLTALPVLGVVGGYGAGLGFVTQWRRGRGAPLWRDAPALRPVATVVPVGERLVPSWGVAGSW